MTRRAGRHRMRPLAAAAAAAVALGIALPALASAQPAPPAETPPAETPLAETPPAETPLTVALETLRATPGADATALAAAEAIAGARGSATDAAESGPVGAYEEGTEFLRRLGIEPFLYPTGAPFCTADGDLPLGIAPAVAGAIPGPWPATLPVDIVDPGQTLFAFVPVGLDDDADASGMQLAWLNVDTFDGGLVPMGTLDEVATAAIPDTVPPVMRPMVDAAISRFISDTVPYGGVRVAPVDTGAGTVLAATFGTVRNGETSCFFLPTIGIVDVPD